MPTFWAGWQKRPRAATEKILEPHLSVAAVSRFYQPAKISPHLSSATLHQVRRRETSGVAMCHAWCDKVDVPLRRDSTVKELQPGVVAPSVDLLRDLGEADTALLHSKLTHRDVRCGETIIHFGDAGDCLYLVRSGELEVRRDNKLLARLATDHVVGEMALLDHEPRNADGIAVTDCVLGRLAATDFEELCRQAPQLRLLLTRLVARRLNWSDADILKRHIG